MLTLRVHFYLEALSEWREEWQNWLLWNERVPCFFFSLGRLMTLKVCNLPQRFTTNSITASWVQHPESWELRDSRTGLGCTRAPICYGPISYFSFSFTVGTVQSNLFYCVSTCISTLHFYLQPFNYKVCVAKTKSRVSFPEFSMTTQSLSHSHGPSKTGGRSSGQGLLGSSHCFILLQFSHHRTS